MPKEKWQVLERAYRSWLVKRKRQELADQTLVPMSVCLSVRQCWCKGVCVCVCESMCAFVVSVSFLRAAGMERKGQERGSECNEHSQLIVG